MLLNRYTFCVPLFVPKKVLEECFFSHHPCEKKKRLTPCLLVYEKEKKEKRKKTKMSGRRAKTFPCRMPSQPTVTFPLSYRDFKYEDTHIISNMLQTWHTNTLIIFFSILKDILKIITWVIPYTWENGAWCLFPFSSATKPLKGHDFRTNKC